MIRMQMGSRGSRMHVRVWCDKCDSEASVTVPNAEPAVTVVMELLTFQLKYLGCTDEVCGGSEANASPTSELELKP